MKWREKMLANKATIVFLMVSPLHMRPYHQGFLITTSFPIAASFVASRLTLKNPEPGMYCEPGIYCPCLIPFPLYRSLFQSYALQADPTTAFPMPPLVYLSLYSLYPLSPSIGNFLRATSADPWSPSFVPWATRWLPHIKFLSLGNHSILYSHKLPLGSKSQLQSMSIL